MVRPAAILVLVFLLAACEEAIKSSPARALSADVVYTNGRIYTVNGDTAWAEAVAIRDGRFVIVGTAADAMAVVDESTSVVDLEGRFVMPGLIDPHTHMFEDYHNQNFAFGTG